jgi:glucose/arabinose dehydrogenase
MLETICRSARWAAAVLLAALAPMLGGVPASVGQPPSTRPVTRPALLSLALVVNTGPSSPVHVTHAGDGSGRLFLVEQAGRIRIIRNGMLEPTPFLDIRSRVVPGGERGLLSVAFHPNYASNGRFFVNYTANRPTLTTVIAEYRVSGNPDIADTTETTILEIPQPFDNHNGGLNKFGPDGMLYIGMGDGGDAGDPQNNGQRLDTLLGKMLRIDINVPAPARGAAGASRPSRPREPSPTYLIPPDNPFVGQAGVRGEIWAYGLRNPWRWSFDRSTGRLFLGDVGQDSWEEIDIIQRGGNYGWRITEGAHCFNPPAGCSMAGLQLPISEYSHSLGCSVTGGYMYRGNHIPRLRGHYLSADYCSGRIWSLQEVRPGVWVREEFMQTTFSISSFGEDQAGEVYVVDRDGAVYRFAEPMPARMPFAR